MLSTLQVLTPPTIEPVSTTMAAQHLRLDSSDFGLLGVYIASARAWTEEFLGRALALQKLRWVTANSPAPPGPAVLQGIQLVLPPWQTFGSIMQRPLELPRSPVQSIDRVAWGSWGADDTIADPSTYTSDIESSPALVRIPPGAFGLNVDHIVIDFTAGYASVDMIPMPIVHAILLLTAFFYERRGDEEDSSAPAAIERLLWPYRLVTFG